MSQRVPSETIEYERYVDGLRQQNAIMSVILQKLVAKADDLIAAIDETGGREAGLFETYTSALSAAASEAERLLDGAAATPATSPIIVHIEGGLVQDVRGVPMGYELRVEDYDMQDPGDESCNAEKECVVTVYEGAAS